MKEMPESTIATFLPSRRWKIALNVVASVLALVAILLMANYLASRHARRLHWSSDTRFQLSPVTKEVLRSITNQAKVVVFYDRTKPMYDLVSDLLRQYRAECPRLQIDYVDYERSLGRALAVQAEYGLAPASEGDRVVFDIGGRRRVVYARDLSEYDYNAILRGEEARLTGFKGEQLFTSALFSLLEPRPVRVYFLQGHKEHDPSERDDQVGYSRFGQLLQESQITVSKLDATALFSGPIPSDCQLLVIANPLAPLAREELESIDKYLGAGGRLLVFFSYNGMNLTTGLEKLLAKWGVEVGHNFVCEAPNGEVGDNMRLIVTRFGNHPVVSGLVRSRLLMIAPRSVGMRSKMPQSADAPKVTELATTSVEGVASQASGRIERQGVAIPLAVAVEKGAIQGLTADRGAARLVVVGDSYFLANTVMQVEANRDFARGAVNWLVNRDVLVQGIGARSVKEYRITMSESELTRVRWLFLAGFPGGVLFIGFLVWLRRRT
jgi:hypothetical protein